MSLVCALLMTLCCDDWPQWLGPTRDNVSREKVAPWTEPPKVLWKKPVGEGHSSPIVARDRVVLHVRVPGKDEEEIVVVDARTGEDVWRKTTPRAPFKSPFGVGPRATPLVHGGKVYTLGAMGNLFCFDEKTGKILWEKQIAKEYKTDHPIWGYAAHPFIDGQKLILLVGGDGSAVVAFDKDTGMEIWKALDTQEVCYAPPIITEAGGKRQLIVWLSEALYSLDPETGKQYWLVGYPEDGKPQRPAVNIAIPLRIDDLIFVSSFYHGALAVKLAKDKPAAEVAYRTQMKKGEDPEEAPGLHALMTTPIARDGYIYGVGATGELKCLKASTGKPMWMTRKPLDDKKADCGTLFFVVNGDRYFLFTDLGELIIAKLTPKGYEEIDRAKVIEPSQSARGRNVVWSQPAFARKCAFIRSDKEIICVSLAKE